MVESAKKNVNLSSLKRKGNKKQQKKSNERKVIKQTIVNIKKSVNQKLQNISQFLQIIVSHNKTERTERKKTLQITTTHATQTHYRSQRNLLRSLTHCPATSDSLLTTLPHPLALLLAMWQQHMTALRHTAVFELLHHIQDNAEKIHTQSKEIYWRPPSLSINTSSW